MIHCLAIPVSEAYCQSPTERLEVTEVMEVTVAGGNGGDGADRGDGGDRVGTSRPSALLPWDVFSLH